MELDVTEAAKAHAEAIEAVRVAQQGTLLVTFTEGFTAIMVAIKELQVQGVATNDHLARLNSKVATQEGQINTLMLWKATISGFNGAVSMGWTTLVSLLSGGLVAVLYWVFRK